MQHILSFAEGPLFRFAIALFILGLLQQVLLSVWGFVRVRRQAGKRDVRFGPLVAATLRQVNPFRYLLGPRGGYTLLTLVMHVGLLVVPIFLAGHIFLLSQGIGYRWPHLPMGVADVLTLLTLVSALLLVVARLANHTSRSISRLQDWILPLLIAAVFASGYVMVNPRFDLLPYPATRLIHVLSANLLLLLVPFTKIVHMVGLPFSQLAGEFGWRFVPGAGENVRKTLGKQGEAI